MYIYIYINAPCGGLGTESGIAEYMTTDVNSLLPPWMDSRPLKPDIEIIQAAVAPEEDELFPDVDIKKWDNHERRHPNRGFSTSNEC